MSKHCLEHNGKCYDIGTKIEFTFKTSQPLGTTLIGVLAQCETTANHLVVNVSGYDRMFIKSEFIIVNIIEPVYTAPPEVIVKNKQSCPPSWDIEVGWVWYILIMLIGTIFKDRWIIWIFATLYFFAWKNGSFNGGKK